ncbi:hypothetical protein PR202_gb11708 [Eleusine coracana subsp. coracana]|uniref:Uncharacterized protein n=1 Tax=Eleusine coracana subsp. coracana TaxID=191504 RepID=A0AAV5EN96_ELECO|nr:hypothetical protein PR202_gb11708 [Eleusine coracana subsp. coracana]
MAILAVASAPKTLNPTLGPGHWRRPSSLVRFPLPLGRRLLCSAQYSEAATPLTTPRPAEIPWSKELCNSVRLIGTVGTDIELRQLSSGATVARGRLAVWKSATETTWVTLAFWDDLAIVASEHVKKGDRIYVSGRLVSDTVDEGPEKRQVYYKLNFIESIQPVRLYEPESRQDAPDYFDSTSGSAEDKNRVSRSSEELWQAFFANPLDWWDNRVNKKSPRHPDFKHKSTGEALWVDGRNNPNWVVSQLAVLDSRMGSLQDNERKPVSYMYADEFMTLE